MPTERYCVNCKHVIDIGPLAQHCDKTIKPSLVTGKLSTQSCSETRNDPAKCGPNGEWFEPKE